jgi:hypothetical protein
MKITVRKLIEKLKKIHKSDMNKSIRFVTIHETDMGFCKYKKYFNLYYKNKLKFDDGFDDEIVIIIEEDFPF